MTMPVCPKRQVCSGLRKKHLNPAPKIPLIEFCVLLTIHCRSVSPQGSKALLCLFVQSNEMLGCNNIFNHDIVC